MGKKNDAVNHPAHYTQGGIECIEAMEVYFGKAAVEHYCLLNAWKYIWRYRDKGKPEEDLKKAAWYLNHYLYLDQSYPRFDPKSDKDEVEPIVYLVEKAKQAMIVSNVNGSNWIVDAWLYLKQAIYQMTGEK